MTDEYSPLGAIRDHIADPAFLAPPPAPVYEASRYHHDYEYDDYNDFYFASTDMFDAIRDWAGARNLIAGSAPEKQFLKLSEEFGEIAAGMCRGDLAKIKDSIGDTVVCLVILAEQHGLTIEDCISAAYDEIKDRKGRMVDGIFIKEEA